MMFSRMRLSSSAAEGWHRSTRLVKVRGNRSQGPWLLSSVRLEQNLEIVKDFLECQGGPEVVRYEFMNASRILQRTKQKQWRPKKQPFAETLAQVYRLGKYSTVVWDLWRDEDVVNPVNAVPMDKPLPLEDGEKVKQEYLVSVLKEGKIFSVKLPSGTEEEDFYFQILSLSTREVKKPFTVKRTPVRTCGLFLNVQPMKPWGAEPGGGLQVFADGESTQINLMALTNWPSLEGSLLRYDHTSAGDTEGCLLIKDPHKARPTVAILDEKSPVLALVRHLQLSGWRPMQALRDHTPQQLDLAFSTTNLASRGPYLRCLANIEVIWRLGYTLLAGNECQDYYRCALKGYVVEPKLGAKHYAAILKGEPPPVPELPALPPPPPVPALEDQAREGLDADSDEEILQALGEPTGPLPHPTPPLEISPSRSSSSSSSSSASSTSDEELAAEGNTQEGDGGIRIPVYLEGGRLLYEDKRETQGFARYKLMCRWHHGCFKYRQCEAGQVRNFGPLEPLGYLGAWQRVGAGDEVPDKAAHRLMPMPTLDTQRAWLVEQGLLPR